VCILHKLSGLGKELQSQRLDEFFHDGCKVAATSAVQMTGKL
jgi:hypothetical protein